MESKVCLMKITILSAIIAIIAFVEAAESADRVRIGVSNYNISNLTVGVAQTRDFFKRLRFVSGRLQHGRQHS